MRFLIFSLMLVFLVGQTIRTQGQTRLAGGPFDLEFTEIAPGIITGIRPAYWRTPVTGASTIIISVRLSCPRARRW